MFYVSPFNSRYKRFLNKVATGFTLCLVSLFAASGCSTNSTSPVPLERTYYAPWEKEIGYAQVVRSGNMLYVSGTVSGGETAQEQMHGVYNTLETILSEHGATTLHIVREVIYTTDIEALKTAIPARKEHFPHGDYPSASWVQVDRLYAPEVMLEVEVIVQLPES